MKSQSILPKRSARLLALVLAAGLSVSGYLGAQTTEESRVSTTEETTAPTTPVERRAVTKKRRVSSDGATESGTKARVKAERDAASTRSSADTEAAQTRADAAQTRANAEREAGKTETEGQKSAADIRIEAERERANAKVEAAETRAAAKVEAAETRAAAKQAGTEERADAKSESRTSVSNSGRLDDRFGAYVSLWGDPYPAPIGVNVAYNVTDFTRVNIGVGAKDDQNLSSVSTVGAGVKFLVPNWSLTPIAGINVSTTSSGNGGPGSVRGFNPSGTRAYVTAGVDWQTGIGLNVAAGYAQSTKGGEDGNVFFNAGFFL